MKTPLKKIRIGDILVELGFITLEQLQRALDVHKGEGLKLGDALIKLGYIDEVALGTALADQLKVPYIDLKHYPIKSEIIRKVPERIARRYKALLIDIVHGEYLVGMSDPTDLMAYDELQNIFGSKMRLAVVAESDVVRIIDLVYRRTEDITSFAQELKEELVKTAPLLAEKSEISTAEAAPVVKMLESIFADAVQMGASDIHIEPDEKFLRIRQRIDGVLQEQIVHGKEIISALALRIKLIANLDISEKRLPQDGRFTMQVKGRHIDVRLSTMPVYYGESIVMRLLDKTGGILKFEQLGIPGNILERLRTIIHKPNGIILVTGPTGSGKTTTLYAALNELNTPEKKIITIEDPVEYTLPRINQIQAHAGIGLTFANILRSTLRQDPDIIMVGEMRDEETVEIGLRAALTGHLVLSTLHTNDSIGSVFRLMDMGGQGYMVAASLRGILAQRLLRRLCDACVMPYEPSKREEVWIRSMFGENLTTDKLSLKTGKGCSRCGQTGYHGRIGVYELLEMNDVLAEVLRINDNSKFIEVAKKQPHFKSLAQAAFEYALQGTTSLLEVFRITGEAG